MDNKTFQQCKYACLDHGTECGGVTWEKAGINKRRCWLKNNEYGAPGIYNSFVSAKVNCIRTEGTIFIFNINVVYSTL